MHNGTRRFIFFDDALQDLKQKKEKSKTLNINITTSSDEGGKAAQQDIVAMLHEIMSRGMTV